MNQDPESGAGAAAPAPEDPKPAKKKASTRGKSAAEDPFTVPKGMSLAEHFTRFHCITDAHMEALRKPMPKDAVQTAKAADSGKKYDATGYGYQWVADRLSEVFGPGGWTEGHDSIETTGTWGKYKTTFYHITCKMTLMVGHWVTPLPDSSVAGAVVEPVFCPVGRWIQYGEHRANNRGDARKGAHTNALKKVAALGLGVGASAFRGTIDEDMAGHQPPPAEDRQPAQPPRTPAQEAERKDAESWGSPKQMQATKPGGCCLCSNEVQPGEWIVYPVPHPYSGKKAAAHQACYDKEYPPQGDNGQQPEDVDDDLPF